MFSAYEVTAKDIQDVLEAYSLRVSDTQGKSFETMANELEGEIDLEEVAKVALATPGNKIAQSQAAFNEIHRILVEMGVIEF